MAAISRLVQRDGTFYFRMATPQRLIPVIGRREIKTSLRTRDPLTAKVTARALSNAFDVLFARLGTMPAVPVADINEKVREYFQSALNQSLEHSHLLPTDPTVDIGAEVAFLRQQVERLRQQLAEQSFGPAVVADAQGLVGGVQSASGAPTHIDHDALNLACSGIMRAKIENARILAAQLEGRYDETSPRDPLFAGMQPTGLPPIGEDLPTEPETVTFGDLCERFYAFKKAGGCRRQDPVGHRTGEPAGASQDQAREGREEDRRRGHASDA